jgi:hypothetical protein
MSDEKSNRTIFMLQGIWHIVRLDGHVTPRLLLLSHGLTECLRNILQSSCIYFQIAADSGGCLSYEYTCCCIRSFELLMMDGKTVRNM